MTWNHRVMQEMFGDELWFTIREVHYDEKSEPIMYTRLPAYPAGETLEELREELQLMIDCLDKEILTPGDFDVRDGEETD